jgi:hypothetical protein
VVRPSFAFEGDKPKKQHSVGSYEKDDDNPAFNRKKQLTPDHSTHNGAEKIRAAVFEHK